MNSLKKMSKKMVISIVASTVALSFGIGFTNGQKLREIHIQKEVLMEDVYEQVVFLKNFPSWSPFLEADPSQEIEIKGIDGAIGAQYHWVGNKGKDVGFQEIKEVKPLKYVKMGCDIQKPFTAKPVFEYRFQKVGADIKVTQDFYLTSGKVDAFFMWVFGAKKSMSAMNQRGMELLKKAVENGES